MTLDRPIRPAEAVGTTVVLLGLAASMAILPRPLLPFPLLAALIVVAAVYLSRPLLPLLGLLALYPFYMVIAGFFLSSLPGGVGTALGALKEVLLLGLVALVFLVPRGEVFQRYRPLWVAMAAFYALLGVLMVLSPAPLRAALASGRFHLTYPLLLPVALVIAGSQAAARQLAIVTFVAAAAAALGWLSVLGFTGLGGLAYSGATTRAIFAAGDFGDPINVLGTYMAIMVCFALGMAEEARSTRWRGVLYALAFLFGWALLSTFSRRSILGAMLGVLLIAWIGRRPRLLLASGIAGLAVVAYGSTVLLRRLSLAYAAGHEGTSARLRHFWYTIENLDPISLLTGHGVGTSGHIALAAGARDAVDVHNYYLLLLFESGMFGLGLYLLLCWLVFDRLKRGYRGRLEGSVPRGLVLSMIGVLPGFLVTGMFGIGNGVLPNAPIVWALAGCALALVARETGEPAAPHRLQDLPRHMDA